MYKIGDKVETPYGIGKITYISEYITQKGFHIQLKNGNVEFTANHLKPYTSAHDKLIAFGWEERLHDTTVESEVKSGRYKQYAKHPGVILIDIENKDFTVYTIYNGSKGVDDVSWVDSELSRILTQYLEEIKDE